MIYRKRIDNKESFTNNVYRLFTDSVGGSPVDFANILYGRHTIEDFGYADDLNYWSIVQYFKDVVIPHKIAVYQAGLEMSRHDWFKELAKDFGDDDFLENLWLHDISKFCAIEAFGYAFYDFKGENSENKKRIFEKAWDHHKHNNPHHPEYWLSVNKSGIVTANEMPIIYIIEMVADWIGAGKVYGNELKDWLPANIEKFAFHYQTAIKAKGVLLSIGIKVEEYSPMGECDFTYLRFLRIL